MTTLVAARAEPQSVRRGFEWRYRVPLYVIDSDGVAWPQPVSASEITVKLSQTESFDGTTPSGVVISKEVVDGDAGVFDVYIAYTETDELVVGKTYWAACWYTHATVTNNKPELVRLWQIKVPA